ncbi:MAG: M16 family metallopeptidase [Polyangiales bacterium]
MKRVALLTVVGVVAACGGSEPAPVTPTPAPSSSASAPVSVASVASITPPPPPAKVALVSKRNASSRVVALRVVIAGGSADDPAGKEGLTNLTGDMTVESGTQSLTYAELSKKLYPFAASIGSHTDRDTTVIEVEVAAESLAEMYPLFRDVVLTPRLDTESFSRLKSRSTSALVDDLRGSDDEQLGKETLQAYLYADHPYGHPAVGTERGLASITLDDIRAQRASLFCRERVTAGVAGNYPDGFEAQLAQDLGALPACMSTRAALPEPKSLKGMHGLHVVIVDKPSSASVATSIGFPTTMTRASDDYPGIFFFMSYLGLHRESAGVLYQQLREARGFNYGDYAYSEYFAQEGWERHPRTNIARRQQFMSLWLRPTKPENALFALRGALYLYRRQIAEGISGAEIERFRGFVSRYFALDAQTDARQLGFAIDDGIAGSKVPWLEHMRASWSGLTAESLKASIGRELTGKDLMIVLVSKDGEKLKKTLVSGKPTPPKYDAKKPAEVTKLDKTIESLPLGLTDETVQVVPADQLFK